MNGRIDLRVEAERLIKKYPEGRSRSALLPLLLVAQKRDGYVTAAAIKEIAEILGQSSAEVRGVASFYHMLKLKPKGHRVVSVCHTIACAIGGADRLLAVLENELGIACGETTSDGWITLERTECLAACDLAPMLQVDYDHVHGPLTVESAVEIVTALKKRTYVASDIPSSRTEPAAPAIQEPAGDTAGRWATNDHGDTLVEPVGRVTRSPQEEPPLVDSIPLSEEEEHLLYRDPGSDKPKPREAQ